MRDSLSAIASGLGSLGRAPALAALEPGVGPRDLRARPQGRGGFPPECLLPLYEWHDGTSVPDRTPLDDFHLFPGFYFPTSGDVITYYDALRDDARWPESWFPVFADGGGDFYLVDTSVADQSPVRRFRIEYEESPIEYDSIESMIGTIAAAFRESVIYVDPQGYLEWNDSDYAILAARLNPGVEWWVA